MTTPAPPPPPGGGNGIEVNKDNVLAARKVILEAAEDAQTRLRLLQPKLMMRGFAADDISTAALATWNRNLVGEPNSHYWRLQDYVKNVRQLAQQLEDAARQYGYTDEEIAASFQVKSDQV